MTQTKAWLPYPEEIRESPQGVLETQVFVPERHQVVMGASGKTEKEVFLEELQFRGIPLYKRKGGGGTVLLGPDTIVVTIHAGVAHTFQNQAYFAAINQALMDCFNQWQPHPYAQRGLSDIAVNDVKLVGSSIFRRRQYLLYQASILVDPDLALMSKLLKPPPRQPDYRRNRSHQEFVTSLRKLGVDKPIHQLVRELKQGLEAPLRRYLGQVDQTGQFQPDP